jgi:hypothetical protein
MASTNAKYRWLRFSRLAWVSAAAVFGAAASPVANSGNVLPTPNVRLYTPTAADVLAILGDMRLSEKVVSFSLLKGHMDLQFVGTMPDYIRLKDPEIQVYRVINADEFFRMNPAVPILCKGPIKWMGVTLLEDIQNPLTEPARGVSISFFDLSDYREFTPRWVGFCGAQTFELQRQ